MDFVFGLFAGYFLNFTALWVFFFIGIVFEAFDHHKLAIFVGMIVAVIVYFKQLITGEYLLYGAITYFVVGIAWSLWRYRRFIDAKIAYCKDMRLSKDGTEEVLRTIGPAYMTERLVTWIIVWPFSMLSNLTGDIIVLIKTVVTDWLRGLYQAVYGNSVKKALSGFSTNKED